MKMSLVLIKFSKQKAACFADCQEVYLKFKCLLPRNLMKFHKRRNYFI